jgi:hypothetical protein
MGRDVGKRPGTVAVWRKRDNRARVGLRLSVSRRTGLSRISSASHFSTIHDTAQKRLQQRPEAAFSGMSSMGERFGVGWQPTGCETQHDLVARARGNRNIRRFRRAVLTEPAFWSHSSSPLSAWRYSLDRSVPPRLDETDRNPVLRRVGEVQA